MPTAVPILGLLFLKLQCLLSINGPMIDAPISHTNIQVGHCTRLPFICHRAGVIRSPGAGRGFSSCHIEGDASLEDEFPQENVLTAAELYMLKCIKMKIVIVSFVTIYYGNIHWIYEMQQFVKNESSIKILKEVCVTLAFKSAKKSHFKA